MAISASTTTPNVQDQTTASSSTRTTTRTTTGSSTTNSSVRTAASLQRLSSSRSINKKSTVQATYERLLQARVPTVALSELSVGTCIGQGGYAWVFDVQFKQQQLEQESSNPPAMTKRKKIPSHINNNNIGDPCASPSSSTATSVTMRSSFSSVDDNEQEEEEKQQESTAATTTTTTSTTTPCTLSTNTPTTPTTTRVVHRDDLLEAVPPLPLENNNSNDDDPSTTTKTTTTSFKFVLKRLRDSVLQGEEAVQAMADLRNEATLLASISRHPNIVQLHGVSPDFWNDQDESSTNRSSSRIHYMVLEKLTVTLDQVLRQWKQNIPDAVHTATQTYRASLTTSSTTTRPLSSSSRLLLVQRQRWQNADVVGIVRGVAHFHDQCRVVLRDLKPSNIGFDAVTQQAKLLDFGLARKLPRSRHASYHLTPCVGSPRYMAPEVLQANSSKNKSYGLPADIHALGILLWEIAVLEKPFLGAQRSRDIFQAILQRNSSSLFPSAPFLVDPTAQTLVQACWNPLPHQRPSLTEIQEILETQLHNNNNNNKSSYGTRVEC